MRGVLTSNEGATLMSPTAELDAPTEGQRLVSQPDNSVLFMATRSDLRLVKRPIRTIRGPEGEAVDQTLGETVEFKDGVLRVPLEAGGTVTCINGEKIDAAEVLNWLEKHRLKGDWQEGFWRIDPTAPPPSKQELDTLQGLAIDLDAAGLKAFIAQETIGWGRPELLEIAQGTVDRIEAKIGELEAAHEKQLADARAAGEAAVGAKKGA